MAGHFQPRSTPAENLRIIIRSIPWRLLILLPMLLLLAIPAFYFGSHAGQKVFPSVTNYFYNLTGSPQAVSPTPFPPFPAVLPQVGSRLYTVQGGDSCDEILAVQMRMADAGTIFADIKPKTIQALNASIGQNCHALQPGLVLALSPQYPLIAFGGEVLKVDATSSQQVLPTPLINVSHQQQLGTDCSSGCQLTVKIAPGVEVQLFVETTLPVKVGAWVWTHASLARKNIKDFDTYPFADPLASLNGMSMRACDFELDNRRDYNSLSCSQLLPNTITDDGGAWLFSVTGSGSLDHWRYALHLPAGTRVMLWLTANTNGDLSFNKGNPVFRYNEAANVYVPV